SCPISCFKVILPRRAPNPRARRPQTRCTIGLGQILKFSSQAVAELPGTKLQSRTPEEYGEKYQDHLLEQYKLFVETSQHVSERRQNANNYLLTVNSSLVALYVTFLSTFGHHHWNALIPFTGLFVCFLWYSTVDSYKDLNTAKFKVIHELEEQLPVAPFKHEWYVCGQNRKKTEKPI